MSIKKAESRDELIKKLRDRNLTFEDNQLKEALIKYNYFHLFNGFETLLLPNPNSQPKLYKTETLDDFLALYKFDEEITSLLRNHLGHVEAKLKSSIAHHFTQQYCSTIPNTMEYTNKENYQNPSDNDPDSPTYCPYSEIYPFVGDDNNRYQYYKIYHNFDKFELFKPYYLTNLVNMNDSIKLSFYQDSSYKANESKNFAKIAKYAKYKDKNYIINNNVAVPFWVAIEKMTFGELRILLHYLKDDVLINVMKDFELPLSKRNQFLNLVDFLMCLRNSCSHGALTNRFRTPNNYQINSQLVDVFDLKPRNTLDNNCSVLQLFDVLKILSFFEDIKPVKKTVQKIISRNHKKIKNKRSYSLNKRLLSRMGNPEYSKWKNDLTNKEYSL